MSDIEKLARLADCADELLAMREEVQDLKKQIAQLSGRRVLTTKDAAAVLGVSPATIVNWVHRGWIPAIMSRHKFLIPSDGLFRYAEQAAAARREQDNEPPAGFPDRRL